MRREDEHNHRHGDPRYWGNQRSRDEFPRDDYRNWGNIDRRQEHERRGDNQGRYGEGQGYRYGEDDMGDRNQGRQGRSQGGEDRLHDYRGQNQQHDRDWERRKEEYGYGRHNYDVYGHDVRRGQDDGNWARGDRGDYESYRRYEQGNRMYDNDYTSGFAGRNYSDRPHYGEDTSYGGDHNRYRSDGPDRGRAARDERR